MSFKHIGPRINCDEFECELCTARFLFFISAIPADPHFVSSDDCPSFCPNCGAPANARVLTEKFGLIGGDV